MIILPLHGTFIQLSAVQKKTPLCYSAPMLGTIALDIDGTLSSDVNNIAPEVVEYLSQLQKKGWKLCFITGRTYSWASKSLSQLPFPFTLAVYNGALVIEMPENQVISQTYLPKKIIQAMEVLNQDDHSDFVIYSGFENEETCYYRPRHFSAEMLEYLHKRAEALNEKWHGVSTFDEVKIDGFPSLKCFGDPIETEELAKRTRDILGLHVTSIRDPFHESHNVLQATRNEASKGEVLKKIRLENHPIIAAGDDQNDRSMLEVADVKIVMETAPEEIRALGDIIAPSANLNGIITGLEQAIQKLQ